MGFKGYDYGKAVDGEGYEGGWMDGLMLSYSEDFKGMNMGHKIMAGDLGEWGT